MMIWGGLPGGDGLQPFLSVSWFILNLQLFTTELVLVHGNKGAGKTHRCDSFSCSRNSGRLTKKVLGLILSSSEI